MNASCNVIQDLLPLYHDGVCSEDSRRIVEAHLKTCETCGKMHRALSAEPELETGDVDDSRAIQRIRKGIRRRTLRGIALGIVLVLLLAACGAGWCYGSWAQNRTELLRFAEGKETELIYKHILGGSRWDGGLEYYQWADGDYRFKVILADPFQGDSLVNVTPWDNGALLDDSETPYIWLELEQGKNGAYWYRIHMEKWTTGLEEAFLVNGSLELVDGTEEQARLLETYQEQIRMLVEAAEAEWPFLTE